ncbi:MAG: ATP-binding cassette domain-containing protein [Candidatus Enteromonas sp.]|nr:ATP-binding cassette domain-containing protein [Mollicutes bacterium]MDY4935322.1 ATP-binding cassette domain-containing protein [Candidatus Enteromonas sp.]
MSDLTKKEDIIAVKTVSLTKDYGQDRGDFDLNLEIKQGECFGLVGENGAGKTTFLRLLMGFVKPSSGEAYIYGHDTYKEASIVKNYVGYVPGEINFPEAKTGLEFLTTFGAKRGVTNFDKATSIIKRLQLDARAYPKRMSKGMKQKLAIVSALMLDSPLILLDEPTTGLDPLMRDELLNLVLEEKQAGRTIIMSSNSVEELERVCDRVMHISKGKCINIANVNDIANCPFRDYKIEFQDKTDYKEFAKRKNIIRKQEQYNQVTIRVDKKDINKLLEELEHTKLKFFSEVKYDLKRYFEEVA